MFTTECFRPQACVLLEWLVPVQNDISFVAIRFVVEVPAVEGSQGAVGGGDCAKFAVTKRWVVEGGEAGCARLTHINASFRCINIDVVGPACDSAVFKLEPTNSTGREDRVLYCHRDLACQRVVVHS